MPNSGLNGEWFATTEEMWSRLRLPIVGFQLWYADGFVFQGTPETWSSAPREGVQVLIVVHPNGVRTSVVGRDEYTFPGQKGSKLGLQIDEAVFDDIRRRAVADKWMP